jgi:hypothetical protein
MDRLTSACFSTSSLHVFCEHALQACFPSAAALRHRCHGYAPRLTTPNEEKVSSLSSGRNYRIQSARRKKKIASTKECPPGAIAGQNSSSLLVELAAALGISPELWLKVPGTAEVEG